jgi:electron transport complex protein RnfD
LTPKGKLIFGIGIGALVMICRIFSNYPEGVMFAVLVMNALTPLINRWTIPTPVGGLPPAPVVKKQ